MEHGNPRRGAVLTAALTPGLHDAPAAAAGARVVIVASSAHLRSPVAFDDLHFDFRPYDARAAYGRSKTANILFAVALADRWADDGITANALHPGGIMTNLQRHLPGEQLRAFGAATSVLPAASPPRRGRDRPLLRGLRRGRGRARAGKSCTSGEAA